MMYARELAGRLGLKRYPHSYRGRCPCCDYPGGGFSVRDNKGRLQLYCANGCTRAEINNALASRYGDGWRPAPSQGNETDNRARKQRRALALWQGSTSAAGTPADHYLTARALPGLATSSVLRFLGACPHPEGGRLPALMALVSDAADRPLAVHRTYLAPDGSAKAHIEPAKASLGPVWGAAIRLDPAAPEIVVGEGIESAASAGRLLGLPAWAALSGGNLARGLVLPPAVRRIVIAADPDLYGRDAARAAWWRWRDEGRAVQIALPERDDCDFNDLLREVVHA